ncbi:hypothetical protein ACWIGI_37815 [Nocardia sp. NPDC055321]
MTITATLTDQDKATIRTAAFGAVALIAAADGKGKPHRASVQGSYALYSATGLVGHVLAGKTKDIELPGRTVAALADQILPALSSAVAVLEQLDAAEAENFRATVLVAVDAALGVHHGTPSPAVVAMAGKIREALRAA